MKTIEIEGQAVKLRYLRTSKKGIRVDGARVHFEGIGTVYVQVYPTKELPTYRRANTALPTPAQTVETPDQVILRLLVDAQRRLKELESKISTDVSHASVPFDPSSPPLG